MYLYFVYVRSDRHHDAPFDYRRGTQKSNVILSSRFGKAILNPRVNSCVEITGSWLESAAHALTVNEDRFSQFLLKEEYASEEKLWGNE